MSWFYDFSEDDLRKFQEEHDIQDFVEKTIDFLGSMVEEQIKELLDMGLDLKDLSATTNSGEVTILHRGKPCRRICITFVDDGK